MNNEELLNQLAKETTEAIRTVVKKMLKATVVIGKAENVNDLTCDINRGEDSPKLKSARLNALEEQSDTYYTVVPKEGSWVLAAIIENDQAEAVVISCTEIEKVIMKCGENTTYLFTNNDVMLTVGNNSVQVTDQKIELVTGDKKILVKSDGIIMNNGGNGGVPKSQSVSSRLNLIENDVNKLKTIFSGWTPVMNDGGTALKTALMLPGTGWSSSLANTVAGDIENNDVKH